MKGAIVGDIVGSIYEWHNIKTKDFYILNDKCFFTDDTIAAVTGEIAEAYYGMPEDVWEFASEKLDRNLNEEVERFYKTFATDARVI